MRSTTKRMLNFKKHNEYLVAGAIGVYIVLFTHPAPSFIASFLSSPISKIFVLAAICGIGVKYSILVAAMVAIASILSIPAREHSKTISKKEKKDLKDQEKKEKEKEKEKKDKVNKDKDTKKKNEKKIDETHSEPILKKSPRVIRDAETSSKKKDEPSPLSSANNMISSKNSGNEKFSLMNAAPF